MKYIRARGNLRDNCHAFRGLKEKEKRGGEVKKNKQKCSSNVGDECAESGIALSYLCAPFVIHET